MTDRFLNRKLPHFSRRMMFLLLAFSWCLGLVLGLWSSAMAGESLVPLMQSAASARVTITGLLTAISLPFLLSALAVFLGRWWLFLPIAFGKAFLIAFTGYGVFVSFGSAGWLMRVLLMFSDCACAPLLLWLWIHGITAERRRVLSVAGPALLALAIGSVDFYVVSPFLAMLLS